MRPNIRSRLGTDTPLIRDLIADIKNGQIKIPQFQRKFVWKEEQAFDLLDSIANNYPVGSLLLWRTHVRLAAERNIGNFKLPETDDLTPTDYVLDGQQRLTVVYSSLGAPVSEEGFAAAYHLEEDTFLQAPLEHDPLVFPLRWMFDTTKLLDFRTGLTTYPKHEEYQRRLDLIISSFTNYRIPIITLKELSIEEVCPIFERINSSGTKLSIYDLMVAATWSQEFDLNDEAGKIASMLEAKGFDTIELNTILKCLTAVKFGGIKKAQILGLRYVIKAEMDELVKQTCDALLRAIDLLSTEFRIYSWDFLPYEALIIVLCYIFSKSETLAGGKLVRLRQWFWRASFSERYRVGGENFVSRDLEIIHDFVINGIGDAKNIGTIPTANQLGGAFFRSSNSRTRAFILALALQKPRNITNGAFIDTSEALSSFNRKQFHHIYPRAYLKRINDTNEPNSVANMCMLAASENNAISDDDPHEYLIDCIHGLGEDADRVFSSDLLPLPSKFDYAKASYGDFLKERVSLVEEYVRELCEGQVR